jgi:hypothetical protein
MSAAADEMIAEAARPAGSGVEKAARAGRCGEL